MKKTILILLSVFVSVQAYAQIRVYNPETGKEMKLESLVDQGLLTSKSTINTKSVGTGTVLSQEIGSDDDSRYVDVYKTDAEKRIEAKQRLTEIMNQVPDHHKPLDEQKISGLGTVVGFVEMENYDKSMNDVIKGLAAMSDIRFELFLKDYKNQASLIPFVMKVGEELPKEFAVDDRNKVARRMHVSSYPTLIYIAPDESRATYGFSKGGFAALKMKLGEIKSILEAQAKSSTY